MSVEEDVELKNLVAETLETKGILPKIRAELRANVFLALEENPSTRDTLLRNDELSDFAKCPVGSLLLNLIREFLEFYELEFTLSVFDPETKYGKDYMRLDREKMERYLRMPDCVTEGPLLCELIKAIMNINVQSQEESVSLNDLLISQSILDSQNYKTLNATYSAASPGSIFAAMSNTSGKIDVNNDDDYNDIVDQIREDNLISIRGEMDSQNSVSISISDMKLQPDSAHSNAASDVSATSIEEARVHRDLVEKNDPSDTDLLTFTPVKESKPKDKKKSNPVPINQESKTELKRNQSLTNLGDLPPLSMKTEEKVTDFKAIIDVWPDSDYEDETLESQLALKSSHEKLSEETLIIPQVRLKKSDSLKSDREDSSRRSDKTDSSDLSKKSKESIKSDKTDEIGEEFDEDISELINGHTPSDNLLTVDETISKSSRGADYLESL